LRSTAVAPFAGKRVPLSTLGALLIVDWRDAIGLLFPARSTERTSKL
jgi:hypothetical protein